MTTEKILAGPMSFLAKTGDNAEENNLEDSNDTDEDCLRKDFITITSSFHYLTYLNPISELFGQIIDHHRLTMRLKLKILHFEVKSEAASEVFNHV